jgi:hypothetical protein
VARRNVSFIRRGSSFRRRPGSKPPRSVTLIVCEGETEQLYFKAARQRYRLTSAEIVIADNTRGSAPESVVQLAEERYRDNDGYDKVFCVFDRDGHESYQRARDRVLHLRTRTKNPLPIDDAISFPCFEVWILLHYERTDRPFNRCTDVVQRIRQTHIQGYEKADEDVAGVLMDRVEVALANAEWLAARAQITNYNPFTAVQAVIRHLSNVATSGHQNG